ncbi:MAG: type II toxin-antitoxin system HicB family antitoxin [Oleispira sp.]
MLFMIGIEPATKENEAHGITAPIFNKVGHSCNSATDNEKNIVYKATDAILIKAEEMVLAGADLELLNEGYKDYSQDAKYSEFTRWLAIDVDISNLIGKPKRININLPDTLLMRIDSFVENNEKYKDRSHFLAVAAQNEINSL